MSFTCFERGESFVARTVLAILLVVGTWAPTSYGQVVSGNVVGSVTDPTGAAIPSANVQLTNVATGVKYTTLTDASGLYHLYNIPVGHYDVAASAPGFTNTTLKNLSVELNKNATANVQLDVGTLTTTVDVTEATAGIDTTTAQVQSNFDSRQIVNLPIIENAQGLYGALNLALLSAGVTSNGGVGQGTGPSVGGQRPTNNNFMIEGVDNNNKTITGPLVYVPTEATSEFTLLENQYGSEFGHSTGGQFNTIVKSGTNQVHGSVYEYFQNRNLNAVDESFARQGIRSNPRFDPEPAGSHGRRSYPERQAVLFRQLRIRTAGPGVHAVLARVEPDRGGLRDARQHGERARILENQL